MPDLTEKLARELWRLNRRFRDTIPEWEDAEPEHRAETTEQAAEFINAARRQGAEEERERLREALEGLIERVEYRRGWIDRTEDWGAWLVELRDSLQAAAGFPAPSEEQK
jgi:hypothetical protein